MKRTTKKENFVDDEEQEGFVERYDKQDPDADDDRTTKATTQLRSREGKQEGIT